MPTSPSCSPGMGTVLLEPQLQPGCLWHLEISPPPRPFATAAGTSVALSAEQEQPRPSRQQGGSGTEQPKTDREVATLQLPQRPAAPMRSRAPTSSRQSLQSCPGAARRWV